MKSMANPGLLGTLLLNCCLCLCFCHPCRVQRKHGVKSYGLCHEDAPFHFNFHLQIIVVVVVVVVRFRVSHRRRKMYTHRHTHTHTHVCVCVYVCPSLQSDTRRRCNLEEWYGCPVVLHYWADLQSVHGFHCCDNKAPNAKCQWVLVLVMFLVSVVVVCIASYTSFAILWTFVCYESINWVKIKVP